MISEAQLQQQLALQQLETELLLGVDFIPHATESTQLAAPQSPPTSDEAPQTLETLKAQVIAEFPLCESLADATQPVFGEDGEFKGYRGVAHDVSERIRAETAAEEARKKLEETKSALKNINS